VTSRAGSVDLPDDLALPLRSGAPYWYWLGGRPALDLVNTRRERWRRRVETLVTPGDLTRWLQQAGLPVPAGARGGTALLERARELREAIDAAVVALLDSRPTPGPALEVVDRWLPEAAVAQRLVPAGSGPPLLVESAPADPLRHALGLIALDAARMIGTEERARVRICASETCSARFYDRSPTAARRWCSMRGCGNLAKVRRHRARGAGA
jgi:predicted RNA-binding Zn ribbon-like protein